MQEASTAKRGALTRRWSEQTLAWKVRRFAGLSLLVAVALHPLLVEPRELLQAQGGPPGGPQGGPIPISEGPCVPQPGERCVSTKTTTGWLVERYFGEAATAEWSQCKSFILLPAENTWTRATRGLLYLVGLLYCFLGVAIVADMFMGGIETITSRTVKDSDGEDVNVWNPTVANLTLMALGSSAPEILLSVLGVVSAIDQPADELGPATIVGSAAFNLLIISGVCIIAPLPGLRMIRQLSVFALTAICSVWAYIWLLVILKFSSEGVVEIWEALATLLQFPVLVWFAYCLDVKFRLQCLGKGQVQPLKDETDQHKAHNYLEYRRNAMKKCSGAPRVDLSSQTIDDENSQPEFKNGMSADPYVKVTFQGNSFNTAWKKLRLNPQWNEKFVYEFDSSKSNDTTVFFQVFDHDELSADDFMGGAQLSINGIPNNTLITEDLELTMPNVTSTKCGELRVTILKIGSSALKRTASNAWADAGDSSTPQRAGDTTTTQVLVSVVRGVDLQAMDNTNRLLDAMATTVGRSMVIFTNPWRTIKAAYAKQFREAIHPGGDGDELTTFDCLMHFMSIFWKVVFCVIPPPHLYGGWPCFWVALIMIGGLTMVVGEVASLFGCVVGLSKGMTAITFVALGTSLPDTFASKVAAVQEDTADAALGNVTGSNCVNVFLGIGLPWSIAAIYQRAVMGQDFVAQSPGFVEGVIIFAVCAILCLLTLVARRFIVGAELGGSKSVAYGCFAFSAVLWFAYIGLYKFFESNPLF